MTLTAPEVSGARFQPLSPRRVNTNGNACAEMMKSGRSPGPPSKLSGSAEPSPTMRATRDRAVSPSASVLVSLGVPSVASTKDGAGAPRVLARGVNRRRPYCSSQVRAASNVRRASPV